MSLLVVSRLTKINQNSTVLKDISFTQSKHQKVVIAGETGSGKTTLLKMIAGLDQPDGGEIFFQNKKVAGSLEQLIPGHPQIGYLSQSYELRNNYFVHEILAYANELSTEEAARLFKICRIDHLLRRKTNQLSGGEKQRIALARILISSPSLLLLDEPFSNLDPIHKQIIQSILEELSKQMDISILMVLHDTSDILSWADKIILMKNGSLIQQASPQSLYHNPANEYCGALLGKYNLISLKNNSLFCSLPGIDKNKAYLFLRPEYLMICKEKIAHSVSGIIEAIQFEGSHFLLIIRIGNDLVKVKSPVSHNLIGERVDLMYDRTDYCYL